jgi:hypothetical protein
MCRIHYLFVTERVFLCLALPNIYTRAVISELESQIQSLDASTTPLWGKMNVAQMLAHCNVTYEMVVDNKHPKPVAFVRFLAELFAKKQVISERPYQKNSRTAPIFLKVDQEDFDLQKSRHLQYLLDVEKMRSASFEGIESISFGRLTAEEWNNLMYKHLDHHLTQFGV